MELSKITNFQSINLGCRDGPIAAINWFFNSEKQGIILEDDCILTVDFLYCDWALSAYRDVKNVWHINGNNFGAISLVLK